MAMDFNPFGAARRLLSLALAASLAACGGGDGKQRDRPPPLVKAEPATTMRFVDRIEAVGTARANEQVTLSAPVTERIVRLNFDDGGFVRRGQVIAVLAAGPGERAAAPRRRRGCARRSSSCAGSRR